MGPMEEHVHFDAGQFHIGAEPLRGLVQTRVFAPQNMDTPYLLYRSTRGVLLTLCKICADEARTTACRHGRKGRSWVGTYPVSDLNYAASLGYEFEFYECFHYEKEGFLLKEFMDVLFQRRILLSGFPSGVETNQERAVYCERVNKEMEYDGILKINADRVQKCAKKQFLYKSLMNEFVGKFGQNAITRNSLFLTTRRKLELIFRDPNQRLHALHQVNDDCCEVDVESLKRQHGPDRNSCVVIAAYITSFSRIFMHKTFREITARGGRLFYTSVDNICYTLPKDVVTPLMYGPCVNDFKKEYGTLKVISFYSVGPKETCVTCENELRINDTTVKVKGLMVQNVMNFHSISPPLLKELLDQFLSNKYAQVLIPQLRQRQGQALNSKQLIYFKFTNRTGNRRILLKSKDQSYPTLPLGFTKQMYSKMTQ